MSVEHPRDRPAVLISQAPMDFDVRRRVDDERLVACAHQVRRDIPCHDGAPAPHACSPAPGSRRRRPSPRRPSHRPGSPSAVRYGFAAARLPPMTGSRTGTRSPLHGRPALPRRRSPLARDVHRRRDRPRCELIRFPHVDHEGLVRRPQPGCELSGLQISVHEHSSVGPCRPDWRSRDSQRVPWGVYSR